jgi:hypothetical protein
MDSQPIFFDPIEGVQAVTQKPRSRGLLLPDALRAAGPVKHAPMPIAATACEKTDAILSESFLPAEHHTHQDRFSGGACAVPKRR